MCANHTKKCERFPELNLHSFLPRIRSGWDFYVSFRGAPDENRVEFCHNPPEMAAGHGRNFADMCGVNFTKLFNRSGLGFGECEQEGEEIRSVGGAADLLA